MRFTSRASDAVCAMNCRDRFACRELTRRDEQDAHDQSPMRSANFGTEEESSAVMYFFSPSCAVTFS
jgi:hypothetical protein